MRDSPPHLISMVIHWLLLASLALSGIPAQATGLDGTGISSCSDGSHNNLACPVPGFPHQDGDYTSNTKFNFTKLDVNGNPLPSNADPVCVVDNTTGLTWEVKTADGGLQDWQWTYSWYDSTITNYPGTPNGGDCLTLGRCDTEKFAADVNAVGLCGYNDWRLPSVNELLGIVDYGVAVRSDPVIDTLYFPYTQQGQFWTKTSFNSYNDPDNFYVVYFDSGDISFPSAGNSNYIRLVRGAKSVTALTDNGDGTVTDAATGLMWAQCAEGQSGAKCAVGSPYTTDWAKALVNATKATLAGYTDWRLPNIKELQSLVDYGRTSSPRIDTAYFPSATDNSVWSTSVPANNQPLAVYFGNGTVDTYTYSTPIVRLVRDVASTPAPTAPTANTTAARSISATAATVNGIVNDNGASTTVSFDYGLTTNYSSNIPTISIVAGAGSTSVGATVSGLNCNTTYHYRVKAANSVGTTTGNDLTFTTLDCSVTTYTVTPQVIGTGGDVSPSTTRTVNMGATTKFTVTANSGYTRNPAVSGSCPQGSWNGNTWITGAINTNCTVSFSFTAIVNTKTLTITKSGTGSGTVMSSGATLLINCGNTCSAAYPSGTVVFLVAIPDAGSTFTSWSGGCAGTAIATMVTMNTAITCTATFSNRTITLCGDVNGDGTITIVDALNIARSVVGLPASVNQAAADVNGDSIINIVDALLIARYVVGLPTPGTCLVP